MSDLLLDKRLVSYPPGEGSILPEGQLGQKYVIQSLLGQGSFGLIYLAEPLGGASSPTSGEQGEPPHSAPRARLAIKVPKLDFSTYTIEQTRERLYQTSEAIEAEFNATLKLSAVSGIAKMLDFGAFSFRIDHDNRSRTLLAYYTVYEHVDGLVLPQWCETYHGDGQGGFSGIQDANCWFSLVRRLTDILDRIHLERVVHGDIWPQNVIIQPDGSPTLIDFGQAWLQEEMLDRSDKSVRPHPYLAPERESSQGKTSKFARRDFRSWSSLADIYSLGGIFHYLATGEDPPSPWQRQELGILKLNDDLKFEIIGALKRKNPRLFQTNPGIADIITYCLRSSTQDRAAHTGAVLQLLDIFEALHSGSPPAISTRNLREQASELVHELEKIDDSTNPILRNVINRELAAIRDRIRAIHTRLFTLSGDRESLVNGLLSSVSLLQPGDRLSIVVNASFWYTRNFSPNGRLLTAIRMAVSRGAVVRFVLLLSERDLQDRRVQFIIECQSQVMEQLKNEMHVPENPLEHSGFYACYRVLKPNEMFRVLRDRMTFVLLSTGNRTTLIAPNLLDSNDGVTQLRFWTDPAREQELNSSLRNHLQEGVSLLSGPRLPQPEDLLLEALVPEEPIPGELL